MHKAAEGGQLEMIKFLSPMFGSRVHEKDNHGLTILHWAAVRGHCEVVRYLIEELKVDPQDRDKVCVVPGEGKMCSKVQSLRASCMCVHLLVCAVKHVMAKQVSPPWTRLCNVVTRQSCLMPSESHPLFA